MQKKYSIIWGGLLSVFAFGCVDDYTDANDEPKPDGPAVYVTAPTASIISRRSDNTDVVYIAKGSDASFGINVVDAPGVVDSVSAMLSDTVGVLSVNNFDALIGSTQGSFAYIYSPEPDDPNSTFDDRVVNATLTVSDANKKTTQPDVQRIRAIPCLPSRNLSGWWKVTHVGTTTRALSDGQAIGAYTLKNFSRWQIRTTGTASGSAAQPVISTSNAIAEHAGELWIPDISFGLYAAQTPARTAASARLTFCGDQLTGWRIMNGTGTTTSVAPAPTSTTSQYPKTMTGQINSDGTITITWENYAGDSGTATLTYDGY